MSRLAYNPDEEETTLEVPDTEFDPDFEDFGSSDKNDEKTKLTRSDGESKPRMAGGSNEATGTYVVPPTSKQPVTVAPMPEVAYDEMHVVESPVEYERFQNLQKQQSIAKGLTIIHLFYSIISIMTWSPWYSVGALAAPLGFYAAHKWKKLLMLIYTVIFGIEIILHFVVSFKDHDPAPTGWVLAGVIVGGLGRVGLTFLFFRFWRMMPHNAEKAFEKFTTANDNFEDFIMP